MTDELLPSRDEKENTDNVPVIFYIDGQRFELQLVNAMGLANTILSQIECRLRVNGG